MKMAEVLSVDPTSFFQNQAEVHKRIIFTPAEAVEVKLPTLPEGAVLAKLLSPVDFDPKAEPYLIEISPKETLHSHFFFHKGEEIGYLLLGRLQVKMGPAVYNLRPGDVIYLTSEMPTQWRNPGPTVARVLWVKVR
jgi:quercetin dioxygenase-like cupin family protein